MARSAVYDHTLVAIFNAIKVCEQISQTTATPATPATVATAAPTVTPVDWIQFHGGNGGFHLDTNTKPKSYVGPIAVHEFEGRGLGLVATRKITAGDVLLIEDAFAMSSTYGALISQATAELAQTCCNKFALATPLEMSAFWCLHSQSDCQNPNWKEIGRRKTIFEEYLAHLHAGEIHNNSMQSRYVPKPCLEKQDKAVASIVSSNSRKTEHWNAWTLLLDESESLGGLWLAASLFNHSCLGNVVINYGSSKERGVATCSEPQYFGGIFALSSPVFFNDLSVTILKECGSTLVARAATTIETGEADRCDCLLEICRHILLRSSFILMWLPYCHAWQMHLQHIMRVRMFQGAEHSQVAVGE